MDGTKLFIPAKEREEILQHLHSAHLGVQTMYGVARVNFCWPSMHKDVEEIVQKCEACQVYSLSHPREEMLQHSHFPV